MKRFACLYMAIAFVVIVSVSVVGVACAAPQQDPELPLQNSPVPYRVCVLDDVTTSAGIKRMRVIIATEERDMATIPTKQIAATAYSAMDYFNEGMLRDYLLINVLLMESCASKSVTLARAQIGEGRRIVQAAADKEYGPSALAITVAERIEQLKGGKSRTTTSEDYAAVGKKMKIPAAQVKTLHFELAMHAILTDFYDEVAGTATTAPVNREKLKIQR